MKYQVTPQQITNELYNIFSDDSRAAQYLTGSHPQYWGVLGWCGPMSPMNRAAFLSAFGAEQVAKAEQEARARVAEYRAAVNRSTYHRNEVAADAFEASGEVPAVGSFVWGRWSCLKGEGGPMGELEDLERMDQEGRENPRRLCEVVAVVDASPADFLDREACNRIARRFKIYGGSRYDEQDPQSLKGFPLTWELVFCVRCAGRWFLIDGQGYDYTRYFLMPDSYGRMFAPELDAIRSDREAKEAAERAAEQAAKEERRRQYLERCAPWWGRLVDVEPLQDAEKSAPRGSDAMKAARRALQAAQRKNILTMCRAAFPGVKFACRRSNGWGASFVISWTDGPTEERFKEVAAVDLLFSTGEYYSNMDDSYSCDAKEFQDFAAKYMGYTYGSYECRREESAEFKAEICAKIRAAVPGIPEDGKIRENAQQSAVCALFADVPGVRLSVIVEHLDYNGITAAAWYIAKHTDRPATDGSPTTPTGTDGQGAKGETTEGTPSEGSTGMAYGDCEKSQIFEKPAAGLQLVGIAGGGVAVTGDSRATYKARKEIKSHGATWNKAAKQWEAHDPAAVASLRAWFGVTVQDATPEASAPADELPAPPALVSYDPAEPVERAEFHTSDEVAPTAPTDGSHPATEETPTDDPAPSDGATGAAYGDSQKSQIFMSPGEVYKTAKADRYIIILSDDGEKLRTTDAIRGRFSGNIDTSDKDRFLSCLDAGSIIKADASQLPPVTDVHTWREGLENGYGKAFEIRTKLIYTAADAMTEAEKADTAARMGFLFPLDPLAVLQVAALHKWNASRGNYRHCAALEWLVTQQDEPTAFQMNAGAYPVIFADYARKICPYGLGEKSQL